MSETLFCFMGSHIVSLQLCILHFYLVFRAKCFICRRDTVYSVYWTPLYIDKAVQAYTVVS